MLNRFSFIMQVQGYPICEAKEELYKIQKLGSDEFTSWQSKTAWSIARYHYHHNEFYKRKVGSIFPHRWEDLPIITKQDLQQPLKNILSNNIALRDCYVGSTSGSSGIPFFFAKDKYAHAMTWALIANRYSWYGLSFKDKQARFYGIPKERRGSLKEQLKDKAMNRIRFSVFNLSDDILQHYADMFIRYPFKYIYGYTNALILFARFLKGKGILLRALCPTLKKCISTSELATAEDHLLLEEAFGVQHIREYGISETCLTSFDHPQGGWLLTEETLYNEVVDDNYNLTGGEGKLLSTSLFNKAMPMVRYETGDMINLKAERRGKYRVVDKLLGRTNDTILLPSGKVAAGLTFYYISRSLLEQTDCLKEFIIRQTALDTFVFDIVSDRDLTLQETNEINNKTALYLERGLNIVINRVPCIRRTAAGKLKHFYSELV